jgi:tungstate transport system ATP-binding protein
MYMTGQHGDIMTTIDAGGISFMLGMTPGQAARLNLQPGTSVTLAFNSCDIRWH